MAFRAEPYKACLWLRPVRMKQLIPAIPAFLLLGYRPKGMGPRPSYLHLTVVLVRLTILSGLASGTLFRAPPSQVLVLYIHH